MLALNKTQFGYRAQSIMVMVLCSLQWLHTQWLDLAFVRSRILAKGEWWRLLSGGLVHNNLYHLLLNLGGLLLLSQLFRREMQPRYQAVFLLLLALLVNLALLLLMPETERYVGLSAALHGLFAWGCLRGWQAGEHRLAWWLLGLGIKIGWDLTHSGGLTATLIGTRVHSQSHLLGALIGLLLALAMGRATAARGSG